MTKGFFIESILLRINGGILTDQAATKRRDIAAYMPAAVNYALLAGYNVNLKTEGDRDISSLFYGYFPAQPVLTDADRHDWQYIVYPKATIALPSNQGVRTIEDGCGDTFKPLSDNGFRTIRHSANLFRGARYYRPEKKGIYLFNMLPTTKQVDLTIIVDSAALSDEDLLPIPAGNEKMAIDICVEFMTGQRQMPADRKNDQRDIN